MAKKPAERKSNSSYSGLVELANNLGLAGGEHYRTGPGWLNMSQPRKIPRSRVPQAKLTRGPRWRGRVTVGIIALLVLIGVVAVLSSRAADLSDTVLSVTSTSGRFLNAVQVTDSKSGASLGTLNIDLPTLSGCPASQPRAYLGEMALDQPHDALYIGLRSCSGGSLPADKSVARVDLKTLKLTGYMPGPQNPHVLASPVSAHVYSLSRDGMSLSIMNAPAGSVIKNISFTKAVTRSGTDPRTGDLITLSEDGTLERFTSKGVRSSIVKSPVTFPTSAAAPDNNRIVAIGSSWYAIGKQVNGQLVLAKILTSGTTVYSLQSEAVSLTASKANDALFIMTACASGKSCVTSPNRLYSFNIAGAAFVTSGGSSWLSLQQPGGQLRFNEAGNRLFFDGLVSGSSASQRFVFPIDTSGTVPAGARIAIPGPQWAIARVGSTNGLTQAAAPSVAPSVPGGGGLGNSNGSVAVSPVSIDQIEAAIGMPLKDINFDLITDDQIRAYGYDPAVVRKWAAQRKLEQSRSGDSAGSAGSDSSASSSAASCSGVSAGTGIDVAALERQIGMPLDQIDFSKITDDQIRAAGFEPKVARDYIAQTLAATKGGDCANVFTQDGFTSTDEVDPASIASGSAANVTAQTTFDLMKGGWLISLRWQAPGGAQKFRIYGRDNKKFKLEQLLATVDQYSRQVVFGGFSQLALPPIYDQVFWFSVVPELGESKLGTPAAIKTRVRCAVVWCTATKVK